MDLEVRVAIDQPWHLWSFLKSVPRLEVPYHSIHYLDAIRWLAGEPAGVYCKTARHPSLPDFADTRSSIILDYGDRVRCSLMLNHTRRAGPRYRHSRARGLDSRQRRAHVRVVRSVPPQPSLRRLRRFGVRPDRDLPLRGSWFTEAFEGPMSNLQRFVAGEDRALVSPVDDAMRTMALVEACYSSSAAGGTPIPSSD